MRTFILKTFTITFAVFILYKLTIGREIETFSKNIKSLTNQHSRIEIKQKILSEIKKELMQKEFEFNMQLRNIDVSKEKEINKEKEDRKDERTRIQATQQSELIDQRKGDKPPKNFESAGNDILSGDFNLSSFNPR